MITLIDRIKKLTEFNLVESLKKILFDFSNDIENLEERIDTLPSGVQEVVVKTKAEIDSLISTSSLTPGSIYKITGVHPTLYNDGTNSGTTIYLTALTTNTLSKEGYGEFWNPKYNQSVSGYGIWKSTMPVPAIGSKIIWGGYSWTNVTGLVGTSTNTITLSADWTKDLYTTTNYSKVLDVVEYDYTNNWISRRYEIESGNDIEYTYQDQVWQSNSITSISVFQFGNTWNADDAIGIGNNRIKNSYFNCINFIGEAIFNNQITAYSYISFLTYSSGTIIQANTIINSQIQSVIFTGSSKIRSNTFINSNLSDTNLTNSNFDINVLTGSMVFGGTFSDSPFTDNLLQSSTFEFCLFTTSPVTYSNFRDGSRLVRINLTTGRILNVDFTTTYFLLQGFPLTSKFFQNLRGENVNIPAMNLQTATVLFDITLPKTLYARPDGQLRIRYYNNSDVLVVTPITT